MNRLRAAVAGVVLLGLAAGCGGGDGGSGPKPTKDATASESTKPLAKGLEPRWLIRATKTREATTYDAEDQALFVDGDIAVYAAFDKAMGVSMKDGSTVWSTPVDLHGEVPDQMGSVATKDHHWHFFAYQPPDAGEGKDGERLYTIDVRDGSVVGDIEVEDHPTADIVTVDGADYAATDTVLSQITTSGILQTVWEMPRPLRKKYYAIRRIAPVKGTSTAVLELGVNSRPETIMVGVDLASGRQLWQRSSKDLTAKPLGKPYDYMLMPDGRYVVQRVYVGKGRKEDEWAHVWTLDPQTGATRAHQFVGAGFETKQRFRLWDAAEVGGPWAVQAIGDDLLFLDGQTIVRWSPVTGKVVWSYPYQAPWALGPLSADERHLFVNAPDATEGSILVLDTTTGQQAAGWTIPAEHAEGLVAAPLIAPTDDGLVLGRNQAVEGNVYDDYKSPKPGANLNDLGFLAYTY